MGEMGEPYVDYSVLEYLHAEAVVVHRRLDAAARGVVGGVFELVAVAPLVVLEPRVVVPLVQVLEHGGEDLGLVVGQVDPLRAGLEELAAADCLEPGRVAQDVFVGGEETLLAADAEGDDGAGQGAGVH